MNDWGKSVLEQYNLEVISTSRGRGSLLVETNQGLKQLTECNRSPLQLKLEATLLQFLKEEGRQLVDAYVPTKEGLLYAENSQQIRYVLKDWYRASECNVSSNLEVGMAVCALAKIHALLRNFDVEGNLEGLEGLQLCEGENLIDEYLRRGKELRRVRTYIRNKKKKSDFERDIYEHSSEILEQALQAQTLLQEADYQALYQKALNEHQFCHGNYSQHNSLVKEGEVAIVNFQKMKLQVPITDLYFFMRKVLEKNHYNVRVANVMLEEYNRILPISQKELQVLKAMFTFPEKYWKQMNYYLNSSKTWISPRSMEKLERATKQLPARMALVETIFG